MELKKNIRKSFWNVKKDMTELKEQIKKLTEKYEKLESSLQEQKNVQESLTKAKPVNSLIQIREPKTKKNKKKSN